MTSTLIKIGEHTFNVKTQSTNVFSYINKHFRTMAMAKNNMDNSPTIEIDFNYGKSFVNFDVIITNHRDKICYERKDYLLEINSDYKFAKLFVYNEFALKHALLNLYSSFIVHHNWGILLHSSCVINNHGACVFSGQSGAGKSTAARLSQPRELLSDEATLIKITENEVIVFDSPFRSELESTHIQSTYPLASINFLNQSLVNKRYKLSKSEGFSLLIDKVFFWTSSKEEMRKIFNLLKLLAQQVPMHNLYFQKNNTFWEMIS
ncbi:hypothetical protein FS935_04620 [Metabacillus litoralis]|uniref:Aldolase n=1 Tax=Metabacillus litoralis TaxID=152268 RepID=A0A5C6W3K4_9BACI|nr:hypothetical protein [Metabacillus litoralis]TXC92343.1 hypothetical protein FS935_04620 [Metabacillus litoralis]